MKLSTLLSTVLVSSSILGFADPLPEPAPKISSATTGFNLDWDGSNGNTYFVEYSSDLITWQYMPVIESGTGGPLGYGFGSPDDRLFLRLKYTDVATSNALTDDFDGDGISNWDEVRLGGSGTNPFLWDTDGDGTSDYYSDRDGNGMADGWEMSHGNLGDLDPNGNDDDDSLSNLEESLMGSNPLLADTDSDGKDDDEESIWWDSRLTWARSPDTHYAVIELEGLNLTATSYMPKMLSYDRNIQIYQPDYFFDTPKSEWEIIALSNAGHVLLQEDLRHPTEIANDAGFQYNNGILVPASIGNSILNHVWSPFTGSWIKLNSNKLDGDQTTLAVGTDIASSEEIIGYAWVPLEDAQGNPINIEKTIIKWDEIKENEKAKPTSPLSSLGLIHSSFGLTLAIGEQNNYPSLYLSSNGGLVNLPDVGDYRTRSGDTFLVNSSGDTEFKQNNTGTEEAIIDDGEKIGSVKAACRIKHSVDDSDVLALSSNLWVRDSSNWKKIKKHPSSNSFIKGKGVSNQGVILGVNGQTVITNGKTTNISDLVSGSDWTDFKMAKMNDAGMMVGRATKGGSEKIVLLLPVEVAVDANRDGEIKFDGSDKTTAEKPYQFWVNDDHDIGHTVDDTDWEEDDVNDSISNALEAGLHNRRDLEDLTRIWLDLKAIQELFPNDFEGATLSVRMDLISGAPGINLFKTVEADGGREYLKDSAIGWNQYHDGYEIEVARLVRIHGTPTWTDLPNDELVKASARDGKVFLLLEGAGYGKAKILFRLKKGDLELDLPPVYIDLKKVTDMYETWTVGDVSAAGVQWENTWPAASATQTTGQSLPAPETEEEKDYILFIHGWNMPGWEKETFASTMFKRIWHQGYKGRFGAFRWPTFHGMAGFDDWSTLHSAHYDGSEQRAWNSASRLAALVNNRAATFKDNSGKSLVRCYAHSMGNVVTGEALRQLTAGKVHTYISAQAAIPAHVWDNTTPSMPYGMLDGPTTPNIYGYYWQSGVTSRPDEWQGEGRPSYMAPQYMPLSTRYINHYNPDDWALATDNWQRNQRFKPDVDYDYGISPLNWTKHFYHQPILNTTELSFPSDRFEIFAYAAEARSFATGAEGATGGKFDVLDSVNLRTQFSFEKEHKGHSAQFRSYIQKRWTYWKKALDDMKIVVPEINGEN